MFVMRVNERLRILFFSLSVVFVISAIYLAFIYAPTHDVMGDVQRIFYFHVASAWVSYVAFGVTFIASLLYLKNQDLKWDGVAYNSAEIGVIFCALGIITGAIWGKASWGTFWIWEDFKLFMTLVLLLVFIAYLALRANVKQKVDKARLSAVFGIIGAVCVPLSFAANRIWEQYHPTVIVTTRGSLQSSMYVAFGVALIAFSCLYVYLMLEKLHLDGLREQVDVLKDKVGERKNV